MRITRLWLPRYPTFCLRQERSRCSVRVSLAASGAATFPACAAISIYEQSRSEYDQRSTSPAPLCSARLDWSSAIGLFIINYGVLDWHVYVFLESKLPPREFAATKKGRNQDRIQRVKKLVDGGAYSPATKKKFAVFFDRLDPVRELRNHIAHGHLLTRMDADGKSLVLTLSLPRNLDQIDAPETRNLSFAELTSALSELTALIEEFARLSGFQADGILILNNTG